MTIELTNQAVPRGPLLLGDLGMVSPKSVLLFENPAIRALTVEMLRIAADTHRDCALDDPETYPTIKEVINLFSVSNIKQSAVDMSADFLHDLAIMLRKGIEQVEFQPFVSQICYDREGVMSHVKVKLEINEDTLPPKK